MFKKILVPLDGSELAAKILPQVEELAKMCQAQVTVIMVNEAGVKQLAGAPSPEIFAQAAAHEKKVAQQYLDKTVSDLQAKGVDAAGVYAEGMAAREIIACAEKQGMDLIALATHGKGEVAWVMGSTAEKIVSHATVPVLLLRVIEFKPPLLKEEFFLGA